MPITTTDLQGLNTEQIAAARELHGANRLQYKKELKLAGMLAKLGTEPMILLLLAASAIYFISGTVADAVFLLLAVVFVAAISLYQDYRARNALAELEHFIQPRARVIRNGNTAEVGSEDLVVGDILIIEEGMSVTADGAIIQSHDFSVNESLLTGESLPVFKTAGQGDCLVYSGTNVTSGSATVRVTNVGNRTELGRIGKSLANIHEEKTPLEIQMGRFVKRMAMGGGFIFLLVWSIQFSRSHSFTGSLLKALTLAMSILPEEIPVAFTTFMALGAWRLIKMGVVVKNMKTVETLGSATIICTDKTGTLTENRMTLARLFVWPSGHISGDESFGNPEESALIRAAMWASEPRPFDPMEIALHQAYATTAAVDERPLYTMIHEYPLGGAPPMMTHVFRSDSGTMLIAAKGAPEAIMNVSQLDQVGRRQIETAMQALAEQGYRLLGVGTAIWDNEHSFPADQQDFRYSFEGIVAFYDPPRKNIPETLQTFTRAGIKLKIVTGDNPVTTMAIARQIGFNGADNYINGAQLMQLKEPALSEAVTGKPLFTRMFPEAKLKLIEILKQEQEIVAMVGDGVNDGPALKAAHIGIAMGKRGTEVARQAASLVLVDDDISRMTDAILMGRKIYANLKKAIRYIISIHIPIVLVVLLPLVFSWAYPDIFSPVHVILLELIMGPTCSIIYENEPAEKNIMLQRPRPYSAAFFSLKELAVSILQGLMLTAGILGIYLYAVYTGNSEAVTRAMVFITLLSGNMALTFVNRSFYYSIGTTMRYRNKLVPLITGITVLFMVLLFTVPLLTRLFELGLPSAMQILGSIITGCCFVFWFEVVKWIRRNQFVQDDPGPELALDTK